MRIRCHRYRVDGWGVGEVWVRGAVVVHHELPSAGLEVEMLSPLGGAKTPSGTIAERVVRAGAISVTDVRPLRSGGGTVLADPASEIDVLPADESEGELVDEVEAHVRAHLSGVPTRYDGIELDLDGHTEFHRRLVDALRRVPWGEVVTYGELAALAGRPGAARAAGSMCAGNPFALVVPCHRVIAADGIGGYGSAGVELKRRLLALEGVVL